MALWFMQADSTSWGVSPVAVKSHSRFHQVQSFHTKCAYMHANVICVVIPIMLIWFTDVYLQLKKDNIRL